MRRSLLLGLALVFVGGLSCFDARSPLGPDAQHWRKVTAASECGPVTETQIRALVDEAFETAPSPSSVQGQLNEVFNATTQEDAQAAAVKVMEFILKQFRDQHGSLKSEEKFIEFVNALFCYVGIEFEAEDMDNLFVVYPDPNNDQTFTNDEGTAGFIVPRGGSAQLEIVTVSRLPDFTQLNTPLDVHPMILRFERTGTENFAVNWIISICPGPNVPDEVYEHLLVGQQHQGVFKLLNKPGPNEPQGVNLECAVEGVISEARLSGSGSVSRDLIALNTTRGTVSGSTGTFSEFGTTDKRTGASGSTATFTTPEFGVLLDGASTLSCASSYPAGTDVPIGCRPGITLRTPQGNLITNAMFDWNVTAPTTGNPGIAQGTAEGCTGSFLTTLGFRTNANGETYVCWRLSTTVGTNTVRAAPRRDPTDLTDPLSDPNVVIGEFDEFNNFTPKSEWQWSLEGTSATPVFEFSGFLPPIRTDATNQVKAGNAVPIKFTLGGNFGLDIFASSENNLPYPQSVQVSCMDGEIVVASEQSTTTAGGSTLSYNFLTGQYTYAWKTDKSWASSCRELRAAFKHDPNPPSAGYYKVDFRFTK
jgi:hypothetical protein